MRDVGDLEFGEEGMVVGESVKALSPFYKRGHYNNGSGESVQQKAF